MVSIPDSAYAPPQTKELSTDELRKRIVSILNSAAEAKRTCSKCGAPLWFVKARATGKLQPFTAEGLNHFADCPSAAHFKAVKP
jgi:hypothetical protein